MGRRDTLPEMYATVSHSRYNNKAGNTLPWERNYHAFWRRIAREGRGRAPEAWTCRWKRVRGLGRRKLTFDVFRYVLSLIDCILFYLGAYEIFYNWSLPYHHEKRYFNRIFKICCAIHNMIRTANPEYDWENAAPIQWQDGPASLPWDWEENEVEDV